MSVITVGFKRLSDAATLPTLAHPTDSGFDLSVSEDVIIEPGQTLIVPTGIAVQLPEGYEAQVRPRSGVTAKTKLRVQLGTIDSGYNGEVGVIVDNIYQPEYDEDSDGVYSAHHRTRVAKHLDGGDEVLSLLETPVWWGTYKIRKGDRIAQLVVQPLPDVEAIEVFDVEESERGEGGFGSTGVRE